MLSFRKSTILSPRLALGGARTMASAGVMPRQARPRPLFPLPRIKVTHGERQRHGQTFPPKQSG